MADKCAEELPGSIVESFTLAIELVGGQIKNSPETLAKILKNPEVQKKIREALEKRLGELQKSALQGRPVDSAQALEQIKSVFTVDTLDATTKAAKAELEKSAKYHQLKASLEGLSCRFKDRPLGTFYDEAEGVLLILTAGVMVAAVPISVETKVAIVPGWFNTFGATYEPIQKKASFSLGIVGGTDVFSVQLKANVAAEDKKFSYGGTAGIEWKPTIAPISVTGGLGVTRSAKAACPLFRPCERSPCS